MMFRPTNFVMRPQGPTIYKASNSRSFEYARKDGINDYLLSVLDNRAPFVSIPDSEPVRHVHKCIRASSSLTGSTDYVLMWRPGSNDLHIQQGKPVTHPITGDPTMGFDSTGLNYDDDMVEFSMERVVRGYLEVYSDTTSTGLTDLSGQVSRSRFSTIPNFNILDPANMSAYNSVDHVPPLTVMDGIHALYFPAHSQPYKISGTRDLLNRHRHSKNFSTANVVDTSVVFDSYPGPDDSDSLFTIGNSSASFIGPIQVTVSGEVTVNSATAAKDTLDVYMDRINSSGVTSSFLMGTIFVDKEGFNETFSFSSALPWYGVRIVANFGATGDIDVDGTVVVSHNSPALDAPLQIIYIEDVSATQVLRLNSTLDLEAVPGMSLLKHLEPRLVLEDDEGDYFFAIQVLNDPRYLRSAYSRSEYAQLRPYFKDLCTRNMIGKAVQYKASLLGSLFKAAKGIFNIAKPIIQPIGHKLVKKTFGQDAAGVYDAFTSSTDITEQTRSTLRDIGFSDSGSYSVGLGNVPLKYKASTEHKEKQLKTKLGTQEEKETEDDFLQYFGEGVLTELLKKYHLVSPPKKERKRFTKYECVTIRGKPVFLVPINYKASLSMKFLGPASSPFRFAVYNSQFYILDQGAERQLSGDFFEYHPKPTKQISLPHYTLSVYNVKKFYDYIKRFDRNLIGRNPELLLPALSPLDGQRMFSGPLGSKKPGVTNRKKPKKKKPADDVEPQGPMDEIMSAEFDKAFNTSAEVQYKASTEEKIPDLFADEDDDFDAITPATREALMDMGQVDDPDEKISIRPQESDDYGKPSLGIAQLINLAMNPQYYVKQLSSYKAYPGNTSKIGFQMFPVVSRNPVNDAIVSNLVLVTLARMPVTGDAADPSRVYNYAPIDLGEGNRLMFSTNYFTEQELTTMPAKIRAFTEGINYDGWYLTFSFMRNRIGSIEDDSWNLAVWAVLNYLPNGLVISGGMGENGVLVGINPQDAMAKLRAAQAVKRPLLAATNVAKGFETNAVVHVAKGTPWMPQIVRLRSILELFGYISLAGAYRDIRAMSVLNSKELHESFMKLAQERIDMLKAMAADESKWTQKARDAYSTPEEKELFKKSLLSNARAYQTTLDSYIPGTKPSRFLMGVASKLARGKNKSEKKTAAPITPEANLLLAAQSNLSDWILNQPEKTQSSKKFRDKTEIIRKANPGDSLPAEVAGMLNTLSTYKVAGKSAGKKVKPLRSADRAFDSQMGISSSVLDSNVF